MAKALNIKDCEPSVTDIALDVEPKPGRIALSHRMRVYGLLVSIFIAVLFSSLYKLTDTKLILDYRGFQSLPFVELDNCSIVSTQSVDFSALKRVATWSSENPHAVATCVTEWFSAKGNFLELEFAGYHAPQSKHPLYFEIERRNRESVRIEPNRGKRVGVWHIAGALLPDFRNSEQLRLRIVDSDPGSGWLSLRTRLNFYSTSEFLSLLRAKLGRFKAILKMIVVLSVVAAVFLALNYITTWPRVFVAALMSCIVLQLRPNLFFYHDDFQFIERFNLQGIGSILSNHHEHVLPLFNALFFAEYLLFADNILPYMLVNSVIHALSAAALFVFLKQLNVREDTAAFITVLFLSGNWLLSEAMQWVTCQSLLLSSLFRILSYVCALKLLRGASRVWACGLFIAIVCAQLSFAGGITVWIEVLLLAMFFGGREIKRSQSLMSLPYNKRESQTSFILAVFAAVVVGICWYLGTLTDTPLKHQRASLTNLADLGVLARFSILGAEYGSLLRSIGVDALGLPDFRGVSRDIWWSAYGVLFSIALLLLILFRKDRKWKFWLFGQLVLCAAMLAAAIGRVHWGGVEYVLKLRYHTIGMIAVCVIVAPVMELILRKQRVAILLSAVWLWCQIGLMSTYRKYIDEGPLMKRYAAQLVEWNQLTMATSSSTLAYVGIGTPYIGEYPLPYGRLVNEPIAISPWSDNLYFLNKYAK